MKYLIAFSLIMALVGATESTHDFHVSKCKIRHVEDERTLQITFHIFIDDLELALRELGADSLFICTERESPKAPMYMDRYFQQKLSITIDGQKGQWQFVGKEISDDLTAVWCYMEIPEVDIRESLRVDNQVLLEVFDDQKNITSVVLGDGTSKHFLFHGAHTSGEVYR